MKHALQSVFGFAAVALVTLAAGPAVADAVGPYYATPSWDQTLPSSTRFVVLSNMNSQAVLDRETGLVWERSPSTLMFNWENAQSHCNTLGTGNRRGWRLPTVQELASLMDPSVAPPGPTLPAGHPFTVLIVHDTGYWSATTDAVDPTVAWDAFFDFGQVGTDGKSGAFFVWCVRGGQGVDPR